MISSFNRAFYVLMFCIVCVLADTACRLIYIMPEERARHEQVKAMRADDAEWETRFKAARAKQIQEEAKIMWLQMQNLDLAKKLTLTLRAE